MNKSREKRQFILAEKKANRLHYAIILAFMFLGAVYHFFIAPVIIGHDSRYSLCIFWLPVVCGILVLGVYRKQFLIYRYSADKALVYRAFVVGFYLLQGFIFSYLSFGLIARVAWDTYNYRVASENPVEEIERDVSEFWTGRGPSKVYFDFNGRSESLNSGYRKLSTYQKGNPANYVIRIRAQKGVWGYYVVKGWHLEKK